MGTRQRRTWAMRLGAALALGALHCHANVGLADEAADRGKARAAYDRGVAAQARGDLAGAAREFAEADAILPSAAALGAAMEAAESAGDAALGATLCERARARAADGKAPEDRREACERMHERTGKIVVSCATGGARCEVTIDGARAEIGGPSFVLPGTHTVQAKRGAKVWSRSVQVAAKQAVNVDVPAEGAEAAPDATAGGAKGAEGPSNRLISPLWSVASGVLTGVSLGLAIGSGLDTKSKHEAFVSAGCPGEIHGDCGAAARDGAFAQDRTNLLVGTTVGLGVLTATLGAITIFGARPSAGGGAKGSSARPWAVVARPGGAALTVAFE